MRLSPMRSATPFPIPPEAVDCCLDINENPVDRLFETAWRQGLASLSRDERRGALLGVVGHVAESVVEVMLEPLGYSAIHHFRGPGRHGVDLLLLTPGETGVVAVEVKGTLQSNRWPRLSKTEFLQMTAPWLDGSDNPGMAEWGFESSDLYGAMIFLNFADMRYRVAFTADFESLLPVTDEAQLTDLSWLPGFRSP